MGDAESTAREPGGDETSPPSSSFARRLLNASRRGLVRTVIGVTVLLPLLWIAASTGVGMRAAVPFALERLVPEGWRVAVGDVDGSWMNRVEISGLTLEGPGLTLEAPSVLVRYSLIPLLDKTIDVRELVVDRPAVTVALPDSSAVNDPAADEEGVSGRSAFSSMLAGEPISDWALHLRSVEIVDGHTELTSGRSGRYTLAGVRLAATGELGEDGLVLDIDTLRADFLSVFGTPVDSVSRSEGRVELAGTLADGALRLDTLFLASDHSDVSGAGRMAFVARPELWSEVDVEITARPLDLRDLPIRLPESLRGRPDVYARATGAGSRDSLVFALSAEAFDRATRVEASAVLRPGASVGGDPALRGTVTVDGFDLVGWAVPPFDGTASGRVEVTLAALHGGSDYSLRGRVRHDPIEVDPSRLVARPLSTDFEVTGRTPRDAEGGSPLSADAEVTLSVDRPTRRVGTVSAQVDGASVRWRTELALDSGRVSGRGTARRGEPVASVTVDELRAVALDLASVDPVYPSSALTGRVRGRFEGSSAHDLRATIDLVLAPSRLAETRVDTLELGSEVRGMTFDGSLFVVSELGRIRTRYAVELADSVVRFETSGLAYSRPDTASQRPVDAPPMAELYGRTTGSWALSEIRSATLRAVVDSARWGSTSVVDGRADAELDGDHLSGNAQLVAEGLLPTPVGLRARAELRGATLAEVTGRAAVSAQRAHQDTPGMVDSLRVELTAPEPGRLEVTGRVLTAEGGAVALAGSARVSEDSLRFQVDASGGFDDRTVLLGGAALDSLVVAASGRRVSGAWQGLDAEVALKGARWGRVRSERAVASIRFDSAGIHLDTLDVDSNVFEARGRGRLPTGGSGGRMDVTAELLDLEPVRQMTGLEVLAAGEGSLEASATGSLDSLSWAGDLRLEGLVVNRMRMIGVHLGGEGVATAPYGSLLGLASTDVELTLDRVSLSQSEIRQVSVHAAGGPDSIRVDARAVADERRQASILVHVDPRPDRRTARIEDIRFQIDRDQWRLAEEAVLHYGSGVSVEPVLLRAGQQEIRFGGGVSEAGELDLNARMDSTDVGTVADLLGFPRLRGWLSGRVRIHGSPSSPEAWVDMVGAVHRVDRRPGPIDVRVRANGRSVRGSVELMDANRGLLSLAGGALLPGAGRTTAAASGPDDGGARRGTAILGLVSDSIEVSLTGEEFDLRWTEAFFTAEELASIGGTLDGSLTLRGPSASPVLEGELRMRNGSARPTALGVQWDSVSVTVRGDGTELVVDSARISGSSGDVTANGTVGVVGGMPLDLRLSFDDFQAIRTDAYWAVVSGSVDVGGVATAPELDGRLRLESLDVFLDERVTAEGLEPVELTEDDLRMLRERFGVVPDTGSSGRPISERVTADLEVVLGRDSWLRKRTSPEMAVPFSGTIDVQLRPGQEPMLDGSVQVIAGRGFVEQFGRRFELAEGTVVFNGPPARTRVDLEATYTIPSHDNPDGAEVTIILEVTGTQDDLGLTLSSNPPLENADIVSYIATGRPASGSLSFEGGGSEGGLVAAGADFALSRMTSLVETAAARGVGLDVVEIRREGLRQMTLVAGKYVTPRLYVGFAQPVSFEEGDGLSFGSQARSELEIEYEALRWLLLNVEGSGSSLRLFLRGRHAY